MKESCVSYQFSITRKQSSCRSIRTSCRSVSRPHRSPRNREAFNPISEKALTFSKETRVPQCRRPFVFRRRPCRETTLPRPIHCKSGNTLFLKKTIFFVFFLYWLFLFFLLSNILVLRFCNCGRKLFLVPMDRWLSHLRSKGAGAGAADVLCGGRGSRRVRHGVGNPSGGDFGRECDAGYAKFLNHFRVDGDSYVFEMPGGSGEPRTFVKYEDRNGHKSPELRRRDPPSDPTETKKCRLGRPKKIGGAVPMRPPPVPRKLNKITGIDRWLLHLRIKKAEIGAESPTGDCAANPHGDGDIVLPAAKKEDNSFRNASIDPGYERFLKHLRMDGNSYILQMGNGKVKYEGEDRHEISKMQSRKKRKSPHFFESKQPGNLNQANRGNIKSQLHHLSDGVECPSHGRYSSIHFAEDQLDGEYERFLKHLRTDGNSYILQMREIDGSDVYVKYEEEPPQKGMQTLKDSSRNPVEIKEHHTSNKNKDEACRKDTPVPKDSFRNQIERERQPTSNKHEEEAHQEDTQTHKKSSRNAVEREAHDTIKKYEEEGHQKHKQTQNDPSKYPVVIEGQCVDKKKPQNIGPESTGGHDHYPKAPQHEKEEFSPDQSYLRFLKHVRKDGSSMILDVGDSTCIKYDHVDLSPAASELRANDFAEQDDPCSAFTQARDPHYVDKTYKNFLQLVRSEGPSLVLNLDNGVCIRYEDDHEPCENDLQNTDLNVNINDCSPIEYSEFRGSFHFKNNLIADLKRPFSFEEYRDLFKAAWSRKPVEGERVLRNVTKPYDTDQLGLSYLHRFPELAKKIRAADYPNGLTLLRGFFFWLKNLCHEGAFQPWISENLSLGEVPTCPITLIED